MKTNLRPPVSSLALCAAFALAPRAAGSPFATSASGVGTVLGNEESAPATASRSADPEWPVAKHTPAGQMFPWPFNVPKRAEIKKTASGWDYSGQVELGYRGGDAGERNAQYRMYQDLDEGAYVNRFNLLLQKKDGAFVNVTGGAAGRRDQYYGLNFGRTNSWGVKVFFSETPHVFTDTLKSLWSGIGTGNLILLPGLTPGGTATKANDTAAVTAAARGATPSTLASRASAAVCASTSRYHRP